MSGNKHKRAPKNSAKRQSVQQQSSNIIKSGFDHGYIVEKLLGLTKVEGVLHFRIKWKNIKKSECVEASIVNEKVPQTVIAFYQSISYWDENLTPVNHD